MSPLTSPRHEPRSLPIALIGGGLVGLTGLAVLFLGFLVAPLAILMTFCGVSTALERWGHPAYS